MKSTLFGVSLLAVVAMSSTAAAKQVRYLGGHPIAAGHGEGYCHIEFAHVHVYEPPKVEVNLLYRHHGDEGLVFVGDPVAHGYEGPSTAYYGPHPIHVDVVYGVPGPEPEYCFLDGPHSHVFAPMPGPAFVVKGDVHYFAGDLPVVAVEARPRFARINAYYKHRKWRRPVVVGPPPSEYHVPVFVVEDDYHDGPGHPPPVGVGLGVGVEVHVPLPSIEVRAPSLVVEPGVVVHDRVRVVGPGRHGHGRHHGHRRGRH